MRCLYLSGGRPTRVCRTRSKAVLALLLDLLAHFCARLHIPINPRQLKVKWKYMFASFSWIVWWKIGPQRNILQEHSDFGPSNVEYSKVFSTRYLQGNITDYSTINWNFCMRLKITLIDAEPHGKRIPWHSLCVPSFLQTTTCLQGSVRFPATAYTDEDHYGWWVSLACIVFIFH